MQITTAVKNCLMQGVIDFLLDGVGTPVVQIYSGVQPAFGQAPTGDLLVSCPFHAGIGTISLGSLQLIAGDSALVLVTVS